MSELKIKTKAGTVGTRVVAEASGFENAGKYKILFGDVEVGEFVVERKGSKPISTTFVIPEVSTSGDRGELQTMVPVRVSSESGIIPDVEQRFKLNSMAALSTKRASIGYKVTLEAKGLLSDEVYFVTTVQGDNPDVAVAILKAESNGSGRSEFIVPNSIAPGRYKIQIKNRRLNFLTLLHPPTLEIQGYSNSSLTPGEAVGPVSKPFCGALVTLPFSSELSIQLIATVYIIISLKGKPVRFSSSALSLLPLGTGEALICFADLEPGSYRATAFAATMTGAILSKMYSFRLEIGQKNL